MYQKIPWAVTQHSHMINTEKLLGKVLGEITGSGYGKKSKKGKKQKSGFDAVADQLTSGKGLMTIIGLGVGAYEIYRQQQGQQQPAIPGGNPSPGYQVPPALPSSGNVPPPPPPIPSSPQVSGPSSSNVTPPHGSIDNEVSEQHKQELSLRMIQVMVAAAHADGTLDEAEEQKILDKLQGADLTSEETIFLLEELHNPKSIAQLISGIDVPRMGKSMYMLAAAAIEIDTEEERAWLDQLAEALGLSKGMQSFLEQQV